MEMMMMEMMMMMICHLPSPDRLVLQLHELRAVGVPDVYVAGVARRSVDTEKGMFSRAIDVGLYKFK
jgi:hypothetical protein